MSELPNPSMSGPEATPFEQFGGHEFFTSFVDAFYEEVALDAPLRALYPEEDLGPAADRLRMFLEQYWGGPSTYSDTRGHPRLRLRHGPYEIDLDQRDRWLKHMRSALTKQNLSPELDDQMWDYLSKAANAMVNSP